jgi:hypothetical protein
VKDDYASAQPKSPYGFGQKNLSFSTETRSLMMLLQQHVLAAILVLNVDPGT